MSFEPSSSASYSRVRLIAIWIIIAAIGASRLIASSANGLGRSSSEPPPPNMLVNISIWPIEVMTPAIAAATELGEDVAVVDVHQLVAEHAAQLALVEQAEDALGAADRGVLRVAPGRKGVRGLGRADVEPRHRLAGRGRELADDAVHRRRLRLADRVGVHGADGELVAVPVAVEGRARRR